MIHFFFPLTVLTGHEVLGFDEINRLTYMSTNFLKLPVTKFIFDQGIYHTDFTICYL